MDLVDRAHDPLWTRHAGEAEQVALLRARVVEVDRADPQDAVEDALVRR